MNEQHDTKPLAIRFPSQSDWQMITAVSPTMAAAKLFASVYTADQAAAIMLKGFELGLPLAASFEYIHIIDGKPSLSPKGALAIIRRSGLLAGLEIDEFDQPVVGCRVTMTRKGGERYTATWTVEDAQRAGLVKSGPKGPGAWLTYPANLCRWRAIGFASDFLFPDLLGGLHRADELGAEIDSSGDVIDAQWTSSLSPSPAGVPASSAVSPQPVPPAPSETHASDTRTLELLLEQFGAEALLEAAGGGIPETDEELAAVEQALLAQAAAEGTNAG